ncbi:MAG TPA: alpha/beta fold hydrolase, partial [Aggregatilineales bacterium]|nr:alpha/beta fold hydrolase [Aggregatilineales bacterium]
MVEFDRSPWESINTDLSLYRYLGDPNRAKNVCCPVLMLHGPMTSHRTWDVMGSFLAEVGIHDIYAADITDVQMGASLRGATDFLRQAVDWILGQYTPDVRLMLIGHSTGGVLARRYLLKTPDVSRISYVFTLGSPHPRTHFSYTVYVPPEEDIRETPHFLPGSSLVQTPDIPQDTFIINILGNAAGPYFDGTINGVFLPEAVNLVMPLQHAQLKYDDRVKSEILSCLKGERFRMQIFLESLYMRTPDQDGIVGPFYFEVNGMRTPYDGILQAVAEHHY